MRFAVSALVFGLMVSPAFACGIHGTRSANQLNDWLGSGGAGHMAGGHDGGGIDLPSVTGGQSRRTVDDEGVTQTVDFHTEDEDVDLGDEYNEEGDLNGWGNENYWVTIDLPGEESVTINCSAERFTGGDGSLIEHFLVSNGKQVIREWFMDYDPGNERADDYIG